MASYGWWYDTTPANAQKTYIKYVTGSSNGVDDPSAFNITSINVTPIYACQFPYTTSTLFQPRVLSETDADFTYKTDWHGITQDAVTIAELTTGKFPRIVIGGISSSQTGLTQGTTMFLGNTP